MTASNTLGRLNPVDLRTVWQNEAGHFTPWLAREDNLELLADTLGMDLELLSQEHGVGPFRADIVCKDTADGTLVLIENQLERTDHTHLGQLLTYAAGVDAVTIVWIAERFTEEHRAALDWLNENTGEKISFFGLEIELWRIGNSPVAPKFNIVSKPNDWTKSGGGGAGSGGGVGETQLRQQRYWAAFREFLAERRSVLKPHKALAQHWLTFPIGRSHCQLSALVHTPKRRIGAELYLEGKTAKGWFRALKSQQPQIEEQFGGPLDWQELPEKEASRIIVVRENTTLDDPSKWPEQHQWLAETLERLLLVFKPRVEALPSLESKE